MPGKSFINDITNPVERALRSQLLRDPSLAIIPSEKGACHRMRIVNQDLADIVL